MKQSFYVPNDNDVPGPNPLVSIIIPVYNRSAIVKDTLESVQHQTYENWECIIVDDFSTDNSFELIKLHVLGDNRFSVLTNNRKKGAPGARNTGIEHSKGDYLIFLDSDDMLSAGCLSGRVKKFQENPGFDFLVFSTVEFKERIDDTNVLLNVFTKENVIERFLNLDVPWLSTGPVWKRDSILNAGSWNEDIVSWQDWELHIRVLLKDYKFMYFSIVDNYWRSNSTTDSMGRHVFSMEHFKSHVRLTEDLKVKMKDNPRYLSLLNGLMYWLAERALEHGYYELSKKAFISSHEDLHIAKKVINFFGMKVFKKMFIKHPRMPDKGTFRRILSYT